MCSAMFDGSAMYRESMHDRWGKCNFTLVCTACGAEFDLLGDDDLDLYADSHDRYEMRR